jgi:outer membrane protein TolC
MASVEVRIGLPLFQGSRQQPIVDARAADVARASAERRGAEREHEAMLEAQLAEHAAISANLARMREVRLPLARRRAEAAAGAFAAGRMNATDMIAARREMLEAELENLEFEQRLAVLGAAMTLQYGEDLP